MTLRLAMLLELFKKFLKLILILRRQVDKFHPCPKTPIIMVPVNPDHLRVDLYRLDPGAQAKEDRQLNLLPASQPLGNVQHNSART